LVYEISVEAVLLVGVFPTAKIACLAFENGNGDLIRRVFHQEDIIY
jgi:hypothetical protein